MDKRTVDRISKSDRTFLTLVSLMLLGKAVWTYLGVDHFIVQNWAGTWEAIIPAAVFGFIAMKLAGKTGFPDIMDKKISNKERFLYPVLLGIAFAIIEILVGLAMTLPNIHVPFPYSIPVYVSGGIFLEILYHLIPTVFLVWFISNILLKGKRQNEVFVAAALLASLWEPVMQITGMYQMGMLTDMVFGAGLFIFIFAGNLIPITLFRKYGFLSPVVWRLTDYSLWHVIWPMIYY
ncbi:hypothetical protein ACSAZK_12800 [Methanosarcina sp. Mfa9]|uniref:hypothetical protein n=1 Tax=Methanosarcina sp. Mfa9 TaxID=3439063 RepID=UPI003F829EE4